MGKKSYLCRRNAALSAEPRPIMMTTERLIPAFNEIFGHEADAVFFAPGRVNLIGEHTDYNGGRVFPCALTFGTSLLMAPNNTGKLRFASMNMPEEKEIGIADEWRPIEGKCWVNYALGALAQLAQKGVKPDKGYDLLYAGDVPLGAGLSSSAAMEVVTAFAFNDILHGGFDRTAVALMSQAAEHEYAGVQCGIMDQFASAQGRENHAMYLDCSTLECEWVPLDMAGLKIVLANTKSPHKLSSGVYNERVAQCRKAVEEIRKAFDIQHLAELTMEQFAEAEGLIGGNVVKRRAKHVVSEAERTRKAVEALKGGDIRTFGRLMNESHVSLRDDYEVTGAELDAMAEAAWTAEGVLGSRMTGGGFGGCTVSLVKEDAVEDFKRTVGENYQKRTGLTAEFYVAQAGDGARRLR